MLKKQLQALGDNMPEFLDLKTGALKSKKPKKEKSPEEEVMVEVKKLVKKTLSVIKTRLIICKNMLKKTWF